jgi:hypothetical protein
MHPTLFEALFPVYQTIAREHDELRALIADDTRRPARRRR